MFQRVGMREEGWPQCTVCTVVKSKVKILQNFVAFSEYMNFDIMYNMILE